MLEDIQSFDDFETETRDFVEPFKSAFGARWLHEARAAKPKRNWLIKDLVLGGSFGVVFGPPGCGKSFLVSDMMLTMAAGAVPGAERPEWFGYKGKPFGVIYVVAEGSDDFEIRLHAWMAEKKIPEDAIVPFVFLPTSVDLRSSDAEAKKLAGEIKALSAMMERRCGVPCEMVVIDTVARSLAGGNENASEVMSAFVSNCGLIQNECGVTVLGVHHGGKEAGRGPRGHEALHGAVDFEIEVTPAVDQTPNVWTVRKLKAGAGGAVHRFKLYQRTVGKDDDGDPITSCVVVPKTGDAAPAKKEAAKGWKATDNEMGLLQVLADMIDAKGVPPPPGLRLPRDVTLVVDKKEVGAAYKSRFLATEEGDEDEVLRRLRNRWGNCSKKLIRHGLIGSEAPWMYFTGKEIRGLRPRGVQRPFDPPTHVNPGGPEVPPPGDGSGDIDLSAL